MPSKEQSNITSDGIFEQRTEGNIKRYRLDFCILDSIPVEPTIVIRKVKRLLIIRWGAMGDIALASSAIEDCANAFPKAEIILNTTPPWDQLFAEDPRITKVFALPIRKKGQQIKNMMAWVKFVKAQKFDLILDLQSNTRSQTLLNLLKVAGGKECFTLGLKASPLYDNSATLRSTSNQLPLRLSSAGLLYKSLVKQLAKYKISTTPVLKYHDSRTRKISVKKRGWGKQNYAILLPGSQAAGYLKRWGSENYAQLAEKLTETMVQKVVIIGGPDEKTVCESITELSSAPIINLCGQTEMLDIVAWAKKASVIIANDTGTAHIAACANRPMVVICGPTDPRRVIPLGEKVMAIQKQLPCINCYQKHCSHHSCMRQLSVDQVYSNVLYLLSGMNSSK